jgi:hypothetical protein
VQRSETDRLLATTVNEFHWFDFVDTGKTPSVSGRYYSTAEPNLSNRDRGNLEVILRPQESWGFVDWNKLSAQELVSVL